MSRFAEIRCSSLALGPAVLVGTLLTLAVAPVLAAGPQITLTPKGAVEADGASVTELELVVTPARKGSARLRVKASRGKILSVSPLTDGRATVRYRAPDANRARKIVFSVRLHLGRRRLNKKIPIVIQPPGAQPPVASAGSEGESPAIPGLPANLPAEPELPEKDYDLVALFPLELYGIDDASARDFEEAILSEIDAIDGMRSVSPADVMNELRELGLNPEACDGGAACLATLARYARTHLAVSVQIAATGGAFSVSLRLVDAVGEQDRNRIADQVPASRQEWAVPLHFLMIQLLRPETYKGKLVVRCKTPGADVYVDTKLMGTTPELVLDNVTAGTRILRVAKAGFGDVYQFVNVGYRQTTTIEVDLDSSTTQDVAPEWQTAGEVIFATLEENVEIRIDGATVAVTPLAEGRRIEVGAGTHLVSFHREGMETRAKEINVDSGATVELSLATGDDGNWVVEDVAEKKRQVEEERRKAEELALALANRPPPEAPFEAGPLLYSGAVMAGLGVAAVGVGGVFAGMLSDMNSGTTAINSQIGSATSERDRLAAYLNNTSSVPNEQQGRMYANLQWGLFIGGGALAAVGAGVLTWAFLDREPLPQSEVEVQGVTAQPVVTQGGLGLQLAVPW